MTYTEYFDFTSGLTLYAKAKPLNATWATGVIALTENGSTGEYSASTFVDGTSYNVYQQAGGSPASSDTKLGTITPPSSADIAAIEADLAAVKAKTDQINAYDVYPPTRRQNNDVVVYYKETGTLTFTTEEDYSAAVLNISFTDEDGDAVSFVTDSNITKTETTISITIPTAVSDEVRILKYAIRNQSAGNETIATGKCFVKFAPYVSSS